MPRLGGSPRRSGAASRRGRWAWRCALFGCAAALGASSTGARLPLAFVGGGSPGPRKAASRQQATVEDVQSGVEEALGTVQKKVTDVIDAPARLQREAKEAVDKTIESLQKDDGRVLDTDTPSGFVGSLTVSLAVLPYVALSFYSTYLLFTTGKGVPAGPNGLFGLAEGVATLVVFSMTLWSLTSFLTRARGLPAGPLTLLGSAQFLSALAAAALVGTSAMKGNSTPVLAGLKDVKGPPLPSISLDVSKLSLPSAPDLPKLSLPDASSLPSISLPSGLENLQKDLSKKAEGVKDKVAAAADKAKDAVKEAKESASEAVGKVKDAAPAVKAPGAKEDKAPAAKEDKAKAKEPEVVKKDVDIEDLF
mmetsp:Transcript_32842/g.101835  ORF Transcript_32842/g.101835 Transcript_32842/m.101835 type:complete len:364 (+) Transcript_32842:61-1152(+)